MGRQVVGGRQRGVGQPHCDGPVDERYEEEMDGLVAGSAVIAAIEGKLVHQIEVEPGRLHCYTCRLGNSPHPAGVTMSDPDSSKQKLLQVVESRTVRGCEKQTACRRRYLENIPNGAGVKPAAEAADAWFQQLERCDLLLRCQVLATGERQQERRVDSVSNTSGSAQSGLMSRACADVNPGRRHTDIKPLEQATGIEARRKDDRGDWPLHLIWLYILCRGSLLQSPSAGRGAL